MDASFQAHPLLRGGHLQTIFAFVYADAPSLPQPETLVVQLSDGDELALDVDHPPEGSPETPIVYLIHGLGGCSESAYKLRIARKLNVLGFRTVRHNHRGCGAFARRAKGIYHSGSAADVLAGLKTIAARWPHAPLLPVGFSLSGTILLNLLGSQSEELAQLSQLKAAMAVCAPIDLNASSAALDRRSNKIYDYYYAKLLVRRLLDQGLIDKAFARSYLQAGRLRQIDEVVTAPFGGFRDVLDYYHRCSPRHTVGSIELPTTILAAADDPIVPPTSVTEARYSQAVQVSLEASGGHLGFISRDPTPFGDRRWLDYKVISWAQKHASEQAKSASYRDLARGAQGGKSP